MDMFHTLVSTAAATADPVNRGIVLLAALGMLLGLFFIAIVLLTVLRRRRSRREALLAHRSRPASSAGPDPWYEAGRRIHADDSVDPPASH